MQDGRDKGLMRRDFVKSCAAAAMALLVPAGTAPGRAEAALKIGEGIPKASLRDLKGNSVVLPDDARKKILLVHFWASWCSFCEKEIADIAALYGNYKDRGMLPFSVNVGESQAVVQAYVNRLKVPYPILLDADSETARKYGVTGLPTTLLCDRSGIIRFKILGEMSRQGLKRLLDYLI